MKSLVVTASREGDRAEGECCLPACGARRPEAELGHLHPGLQPRAVSTEGEDRRDEEVCLPQPSPPLKRAKPANCPHIAGLELGGDRSLAVTGCNISHATLTSSSKPLVPPTGSKAALFGKQLTTVGRGRAGTGRRHGDMGKQEMVVKNRSEPWAEQPMSRSCRGRFDLLQTFSGGQPCKGVPQRVNSPQKPWLPPGHHYVLGVCFVHQHLGSWSSCRCRTGSSSPSQDVKVALHCPSMGLSRAQCHHTPPKSWPGPTSPHSPHGKAGRQHGPQSPGQRGAGQVVPLQELVPLGVAPKEQDGSGPCPSQHRFAQSCPESF